MPKEKARCKCLSIIMLDSVIKAEKKYYPHIFLEECKYEKEEIKKMENLIDDHLEKLLSVSLIVNLIMILIMNITNNCQ